LPHGNPTLQEKGADLIDDAGPLPDQTLPHPVQRLEIQLIGGLRGHELHCRALDGLGDCLRVAEVVLLPLRVRAHVFRRHQPGIMAKQPEAAAEMVRADAGLHADQAGRHIGEARLHLATEPLLPERDCPTSIQADDVEGVLDDIDADHSRSPLSSQQREIRRSAKPGALATAWPSMTTALSTKAYSMPR
jgi:hypothetical protein